MKKPLVGLLDYEMGNLNSVSKALEKVGASVRWVEMPSQLKGLDALVLPGVGAFSCAVKNLKKRKLFDPIGEWIVQEKPFLGICLGYQLLFEESEEGFSSDEKKIPGFGIFRGKVKRFPKKSGLKVPHMGWNNIRFKTQPLSKSGTGFKIFQGIKENSYFYFVHSYFPVPMQKELICTLTNYGVDFSSSISAKKLFACQFHPEKSGANGLALLRNFLRAI